MFYVVCCAVLSAVCYVAWSAPCSLQRASAVLHAACGTQNMRHNLYPLFWFVAPSGMQHAAHHAS